MSGDQVSLNLLEMTTGCRIKIKRIAMKQLKTAASVPSAWIVGSNDRGRKSIKSGNIVYLKNGDNFEIEIFNPLTEPVLADIKINGKSISKSGLVVNPRERFYLDCFVDDKKKFIFKTYEIENTSENINGTSNNGTIEVFFYKEEALKLNNWQRTFETVIERRYYPAYYPWYVPRPIYDPVWYGTTTGDQVFGAYNTIYTNSISDFKLNSNNTSSISDFTFNSNNTTTSNVNLNSNYSSKDALNTILNNNNVNNDFNSLISGKLKSIETGRVHKGEESKQEFSEVDMLFEKNHISHVVYQILPESRKPVETKEIVNEETEELNFCTNCGRKLSGGENFCPKCGTKLK